MNFPGMHTVRNRNKLISDFNLVTFGDQTVFFWQSVI